MTALRLTVHGRVQGVFYRDWTIRNARELGLAGWVRNEADGTVAATWSLRGGPQLFPAADLAVFTVGVDSNDERTLRERSAGVAAASSTHSRNPGPPLITSMASFPNAYSYGKSRHRSWSGYSRRIALNASACTRHGRNAT